MPFYAVAFGFAPGIYKEWAEAKKQIDDFPQPVYKKFETEDEADTYLKERRPETVEENFPSEGSFETYYAVARAKTVGIFGDYNDVKKYIADYPQPLHKKFKDLKEAIAYFEKFYKGKVSDTVEEKQKPKEKKTDDGKKKDKKAENSDKPQSFYAVARGHETGVFLTWDECKKQTTNFKGAKFKKFDNERDAKLFAEGKTLKEIEKSHKREASSSEEDEAPKKKTKN